MYFHGRKSLVEVDMLPWRFPWKLVSVDLLPWNLVNASMEIHRSFHSRWKWTLPLLRSIAALTRTYSAEASMSFHIPQHTSAYFHESIANSQLLHKTSVRVHRLPFDLLPGTDAFPSTFTEISTESEVFLFPRKSIYFYRSFHES